MDKFSKRKENFLISDKALILFSAFFSGISIWWSPDFFLKNTFYNPGDILFPYNIYNGLLDRTDAWNYAANSSFGKNENYNSLTYSIYYLFLGLLEYCGIQNWVLNRVYNVLPTFLLGASISNLILKTVELKDINRILVVVCAIFFVSSLPLTTLDPILTIGWASVTYLIVLFYLSINDKINLQQIILGGACLAMLTAMPRLIVLMIIFFVFNLIIYRKKAVNINKWAIIIILIALPFFIMTVFPSILTKIQNIPFEFVSNDIYNSRKNTVNFYNDSTRLSRSLNLIYLQENSHYNTLFKFATVAIGSAIFLIPIIYGVLRNKEISHSNKFLINNLFLYVVVSASFGGTIYLATINQVPGLWIINNPQYILAFLAIFYSATLCFGLNLIIKDFLLKKTAVIIIICIVLISIISVNRIMLLNTIDGEKIVLGQHDRYFKIPNYVTKILSITGCQFEKALILPSSSNGYYSYKSWPVTGMPNIFTSYYCLNTFGLSREELESLNQIAPDISNKFKNLNIDNLKNLGVRYVINDKSVLEADNNDKKIIYNSIYNELKNNIKLLKYSDENIELYDISPVKPYISVMNGKKVINEIDGSALLTHFIIPIDEFKLYSISTLMLINSTWDVYLSNDPKGKISFYDELKMLAKDPHEKIIKNDFINWDIHSNNYKNIIIYNKYSIVSYTKIISIIVLFYYLIIFIIYKKIYSKKCQAK